ncbi:MAG: DUF3786 domain-containing protein [bacterium]|nr:DUF3786 domain-containing protein [bacterium]
MSWKKAHEEAIRIAVEKLQDVDIAGRCRRLGLGEPQNGIFKLRAFGMDMVLRLPGFEMVLGDSDTAVKAGDRILVLHYLLCDLPVVETRELISFRELTGGQFYWEPFCSRTVRPLVGRIGNDLELLKKNLDKFDWEEVSYGDFGARIHIVGRLYLTLIYRLGDDEFPPATDVLFDASVKRVYNAEDAAVLASRICLALL